MRTLFLLLVLLSPVLAQTFLQRCLSSSESFTVVNCNSRSDKGGVTIQNSYTLTIKNCAFIGCGTITLKSPVVIQNVTFVNSTSTAVLLDNTTATFEDSTFFNCTSRSSGGGISAMRSSRLTILNSNFTLSRSSDPLQGGGGIYLSDSFAVINNTAFDRNIADYRGGSIYMAASTLEMNHCNFTGGKAVDSRGGDIYNTKGNLNWNYGYSKGIYGNIILENQGSSGGSIGTEDGNITLRNVDFEGQRVSYYGGAIYGIGKSLISVTNASFVDTQARQFGGAVYTVSPAKFNCKNCVFKNTIAFEAGGGIASNGTLELENVYTNNSATGKYGGFICLSKTGSSLQMVDSLIQNSKILSNYSIELDFLIGGGIVGFDISEIYLNNVTVSGSQGATHGGGIGVFGGYEAGNLMNVILVNTVIEGNSAIDGGGLYIQNSRLSLNNVTIRDNIADFGAGGMSITELKSDGSWQSTCPTTFVGKIEIYGNKANSQRGEGGGIYLAGQTSLVFKTADVSIYDNEAAIGDDIYNSAYFADPSDFGITMMIPKEDYGKQITVQNQFFIFYLGVASHFAKSKPFQGHNVRLDSSIDYALVPLVDEHYRLELDKIQPLLNVSLMNAFDEIAYKLQPFFLHQVELNVTLTGGEVIQTFFNMSSATHIINDSFLSKLGDRSDCRLWLNVSVRVAVAHNPDLYSFRIPTRGNSSFELPISYPASCSETATETSTGYKTMGTGFITTTSKRGCSSTTVRGSTTTNFRAATTQDDPPPPVIEQQPPLDDLQLPQEEL